MLRFRLVVLAPFMLVIGCGFGTSPSTGMPTSGAPTPSMIPTPSFVPTPTPVPVGTCPTDAPMTVKQFVDADPSCAIGTDIEIRGWLDAPPGFGLGPPGISPGWLYYPAAELTAIYETGPVGPGGICETGGRACASFIWHIDPASGLELSGPPRWLIVKGHLDDPAAETCRYVYPDDWTAERADDAQAVQFCREQFVVVSYRDAP